MKAPKPKLNKFREQLSGPGSEFTAWRILSELSNPSVFSDNNPEVWEIRGRAYYILDKAEEAAAAFWRAFQLSGSEIYKYWYGRALLCRGNGDAGMAVLEDMAARKVPIDVLYGALADNYFKRDDIPSAVRSLQNGLNIPELLPAHGLYLLMISTALWCCERLELATDAAVKALGILMDKDFADVGELPLPGSIDLIKQQHFFSYEYVDPQDYYDFLEARILEARPKGSPIPKISGLSMYKQAYAEMFEATEKPLMSNEEAHEANIRVINDFLPFLQETNKYIEE